MTIKINKRRWSDLRKLKLPERLTSSCVLAPNKDLAILFRRYVSGAYNYKSTCNNPLCINPSHVIDSEDNREKDYYEYADWIDPVIRDYPQYLPEEVFSAVDPAAGMTRDYFDYLLARFAPVRYWDKEFKLGRARK